MVVLLWFFAVSATAWGGVFSAHVDKNVGTLEDEYVLTLRVQGRADERPRLPALEGFAVASAGTSHSTSWVNGVYRSEVTYRYLLTPVRQGKLQIPSLQLEVDGQVINTLPIMITVQERVDTAKMPRKIYLERSFSAEKVYVGQQVIETIRLFYRVDLLDAKQQERKFLAFTSLPLGRERKYQQVVNGVNYHVIELRQALVPLQAGVLSVPRYTLQALVSLPRQGRSRGDSFFDDFFGASGRHGKKRLTTKAYSLRVLPVPPAPAGTTALGVVGAFALTANVNKRELRMGESATMTIKASGYGNLQGMKPLTLSVAGVKIYADKPEIKVKKEWQRGIYSEAIFKYALLPNEVGNIALGTKTLSFFNPTSRAQQTTVLALGELQVSAGEEQQIVVGGDNSAAVKTLGTDLLTIHRGKQLTKMHALTPAMRWRMLMFVVLLLLAFTGLYAYLNFWQPHRADRRSRAYRLFRQTQVQVSDVAALDKTVRAYLGDKFNLRMSATRAEIDTALQAKGLEKILQEHISKHLRKLERILFTSQKLNSEELADIMDRSKMLVKEVERKC